MNAPERWMSFAREDLRAAEILFRSELAERLGDDRARFPDGLDTLDAFYIPTRYPDALPGTLPGGLPGATDARETVEIAREVLAIVGQLISP